MRHYTEYSSLSLHQRHGHSQSLFLAFAFPLSLGAVIIPAFHFLVLGSERETAKKGSQKPTGWFWVWCLGQRQLLLTILLLMLDGW
jgi:hypothetical protein